ncbi:RNA polymerase sigma factor [Amycolatopsis sp. lyj-108]|uniref:RNA polymerase sigma factor n=1 Tax=Amycolatopsis sp. lyj-108 TaxID=2789286 RepID=UPI00397CB483
MTGAQLTPSGDHESPDPDPGEYEHQPRIRYDRDEVLRVRDGGVPGAIAYATKRLHGDHAAAEEVVATAFHELVRRWQEQGSLREPRILLIQIVEMRVKDELRKRTRRPTPSTEEDISAALHRDAVRTKDAAEDAAILRATAANVKDDPDFANGLFTDELLVKALRTLPTRQRQVLIRLYGYEDSLDEAAALLATTKPSVKALRQRGLAELKASPLLAHYRSPAPEVQR